MDPNDVATLLRPLLLSCRPTVDAPLLTLMLKVGQSGCWPPSEQAPFVLLQRHLYHSHAIRYLSGALVYHLQLLHARYETIRDRFKDISMIPGAKGDQTAIFSDQPEPYYEFDALLAAARRAYDSCRYLLWPSFGSGKGTVPASFKKTLPLCTNLDPAVRDDLQRSWNTWGERLTNYRDCIQHYVPVDFGLSSVTLQQEFPAVWTALVRIPDNPGAKSKTMFTFDKGLDALSFGWQVANEVRRVLRVVVDVVVRAENSIA